ncbi:rod-binding protein [Novosphingobium pentaromativorans]|uniref:Flagellar protein FlgJ n=1 Tax=Novosphingobium pentaromativorans US6-1 TaxID=1088721 RepID=G6EAJ3_9SPHN|nr:rod-binding protein [Novosphingobium pentaromativorans]AIT80654.1 flagellar rod assembly protein FlgJ [Novosphingobium pentaromativorans US6-1]EHJ61630.1 flagellar protein FlgJ [Novosphingobium pentaromativorans US6-1]
MSVILPSTPGLTVNAQGSDREKLHTTAKQFEAIFVRQMLAAARKTDFGGEDVFGSQAMDTFRQLQDEHFADVTAESGTLGMASIIEAQMARFLPAETTPEADVTAQEKAQR